MAGMRKGLAASEAIVVVTGQPGVGKSTLVNRAIDAISGDKLVIRMSRMQLGHDEVLDFLLDKLDASDIPASTIKKINQFRDLLAQRTSAGTRVFIIVEDAVRIGEDALAEFEALTAADSDHPEGANIILMGDDTLIKCLESPDLLRLKQRIRMQQQVLPLSASELQGYLKHCFRLAGGEFDLAFAAGAGQMLADLSEGNPRVANNLVESMLTAATEQKATKVDTALISKIAGDEHGLSVDTPAAAAKPVAAAPAPEAGLAVKPQPGSKPEPEPAPAPEPVPELIQDTLPDLEVLAPGLAAQGLVISPESEPVPSADDAIPTLFSSTRLKAPVAAAVKPVAKKPVAEKPVAAKPATEKPLTKEPVAEKPVAAKPATEKPLTKEPVAEKPVTAAAEPATEEPNAEQAENTPDWDRDPTLAELKPDIEALEQAMADFQQTDEDSDDEKEVESLPEIELKDPTLPGVPELTLDMAIEQKVSEVQEELAKTDAAIAANKAPEKSDMQDAAASKKPEPKVGVPPLVSPKPAAPAPPVAPVTPVTPAVDEKKADAELEKIAAGLASAKSIEDVDDKMAETLFGEDFSLAAAQVAAMVAEQEPANEESESAADATPVAVGEKPAETSMEREFKEVYGEDAVEVSIETNGGSGMDLSASQRLATVRALNTDKAPQVGVPAAVNTSNSTTNGTATPPQPAGQPQPIEDQINTSLTQTLKTLSSRPKSSIEDDDDEDTKRGFFSRFKRS
jgi:type II secretory pathway predicted ATPase ExeA